MRFHILVKYLTVVTIGKIAVNSVYREYDIGFFKAKGNGSYCLLPFSGIHEGNTNHLYILLGKKEECVKPKGKTITRTRKAFKLLDKYFA